MPRPKCESCYYLGKQDSDDGKVDCCKRNAPMPLYDEEGVTRWPRVFPQIDWCGEHHWAAESGPADD